MFLKVPVMIRGMSERTTAEVGHLVGQRMKSLRLAVRQVVAQAKVDRKTLTGLLEGTRWPQEETRYRVEAALGWAGGSIQDLRDGRDATELPADEPAGVDPLQQATDDELLNEVQRRMKGLRHDLEAAETARASAEAQAQEALRRGNDPERWATGTAQWTAQYPRVDPGKNAKNAE